MMIFYFFLVFLYSINYIYFSNFIYYFLFIKEAAKRSNQIRFISNRVAKAFLILFVVWVTISTFSYALYKNSFDLRTMIQYFFTLQYLILVVSFKIDFESFKRWIYRFSIAQSVIILVVSIFFMIQAKDFSLRILYDNEFAYKYFPGWPNTVPIPLLISLLIAFRNKKVLISKIILISALVLTSSRGAYLGIIFILTYYGFEKIRNSKDSILYIVSGIIVITMIGGYLISNNPLFVKQMLRSYDRVDIFNTTMEYVKLKPIIGYGGNTIEQLQDVKIDYVPVKNWGHTHNWVLEILLRYGTVGLLLFMGVLTSLWLNIGNKDRKFLFTVFIFLALFQTFIRSFIFIFYLSNLSSNSSESLIIKKQSEII